MRGLQFARELQKWRQSAGHGPPISEPYVVGVVIDLGFCLDLLSSTGTAAVASAYRNFLEYCTQANVRVPENSGGQDFLFRTLDCAVINHLHTVRAKANLTPFDSVKGVFTEGDRIYPGSGFYRKTHVQLCIRDLACIKGVFRVPDDQLTA